MDVRQKVDDLMNKALGEGSTDNERLSSALGALRLIREYKLLSNKRIDVAARMLDRFTDPDFVDMVATRVEKTVSGFERIAGSVKKVSDLSRAARDGGGGRRYRGR